MNCKTIAYPLFERALKKLAKKYRSMGEDYIYNETEAEIGLLYIYDKSERESLTDSELTKLLRHNGII